MIGFVIAMNNEAECLISQMQVFDKQKYYSKDIYLGTYLGEQIALLICGIGKVNAAIGATFLIEHFKVTKIINFGLAGGIGKNIKIGDIFYADKAVQYDFDLSLINHTEIGTLNELQNKYIPLNRVKNSSLLFKSVATGDRFNEDKEDLNLLINYMQASLKDMEAGAIAEVCYFCNIPIYIFKAISDNVEENSIKSYNEKSSFALVNLKEKLPLIFKEIING